MVDKGNGWATGCNGARLGPAKREKLHVVHAACIAMTKMKRTECRMRRGSCRQNKQSLRRHTPSRPLHSPVFRPGGIVYFLTADKRYGWIAREDITAVAAMVLLEPLKHACKTYPLTTEKLSLVGV